MGPFSSGQHHGDERRPAKGELRAPADPSAGEAHPHEGETTERLEIVPKRDNPAFFAVELSEEYLSDLRKTQIESTIRDIAILDWAAR
jgi:hypothetical protein